jgi:membrane-associated phospholipid phosphatase
MQDLTKSWPLGLNRRNWTRYASMFVLALFVLLFFDAYFSQEAQAWPTEWRQPFQFITNFGLSEWVLVPSAIVFLLSFLTFRLWRSGTRTRRALFELSMLYDHFGAFEFQHIFNDWTHQSFPSGHSTTAMATAVVIGLLMPRFFKVFFIIALMTGVSRVVVGDHYPTDVLAGLVIGGFGTFAVRNFFARRGWLFRAIPGGGVRFKGLPALRRLCHKRAA